MWTSLMPWSRNAARIGQVWPPLTANRYLTPCDCRTRAIRAPPSIFRPAAGADSAPSPASATPAVFPITTPENPSLELREFVMSVPFSLFALPDWRICRGEHGAGPFRWRFTGVDVSVHGERWLQSEPLVCAEVRNGRKAAG